MAAHHQQAADHDHASASEQPIRQEPADEWSEVNQCLVATDDDGRVVTLHSQAALLIISQILIQNAKNEIEAEPLPHLGEEQNR